MTSREIADLTGKEHRNVMRDARKMLAELHGEGGLLSFEHTHVDPQNGQEYPALRLPKREMLILVSGYSVVMRARIIDRWQELEAAPARRPSRSTASGKRCGGSIDDARPLPSKPAGFHQTLAVAFLLDRRFG